VQVIAGQQFAVVVRSLASGRSKTGNFPVNPKNLAAADEFMIPQYAG
jgi:hypothetical protein